MDMSNFLTWSNVLWTAGGILILAILTVHSWRYWQLDREIGRRHVSRKSAPRPPPTPPMPKCGTCTYFRPSKLDKETGVCYLNPPNYPKALSDPWFLPVVLRSGFCKSWKLDSIRYPELRVPSR